MPSNQNKVDLLKQKKKNFVGFVYLNKHDLNIVNSLFIEESKFKMIEKSL